MASPCLDEGQTGLYPCAQQSEQTTLHPDRALPTNLLVGESLFLSLWATELKAFAYFCPLLCDETPYKTQ